MGLGVVFALLALAAAAFYGGRALGRRPDGGLFGLGAHPRVLLAILVVPLALLLAFAIAAVVSVFVAPT